MHDAVGHGFADGGFDVGKLVEGGIEPQTERRDRTAGKCFVFGQGGKFDFQIIFHDDLLTVWE